MKKLIATILKTYKLSATDIKSVEGGKDLKYKIFLNRGKGAIEVEGWTTEVRRKRQPDGRLSMYRITLPEPKYRARLNDLPWKVLDMEG